MDYRLYLGKMKDELCSSTKVDELPNDTLIEACYNTIKGEEEKKLKGITKATITTQTAIEDLKNAKYGVKSKYVTNYNIDSNKHH